METTNTQDNSALLKRITQLEKSNDNLKIAVDRLLKRVKQQEDYHRELINQRKEDIKKIGAAHQSTKHSLMTKITSLQIELTEVKATANKIDWKLADKEATTKHTWDGSVWDNKESTKPQDIVKAEAK